MKYELCDFDSTSDTYRIRALENIRGADGYDLVHQGELGGRVSGKHNLSPYGRCWVGHDAHVIGDARVEQDAIVTGTAMVCDTTLVTGRAHVNLRATAGGESVIRDVAWVTGYVRDSQVVGRARVAGAVRDNARVTDCARVSPNGTVHGASVGGRTVIGHGAVVSGAFEVACGGVLYSAADVRCREHVVPVGATRYGPVLAYRGTDGDAYLSNGCQEWHWDTPLIDVLARGGEQISIVSVPITPETESALRTIVRALKESW